MTRDRNFQHEWQRCRPGEVGRLVTGLQNRRKRQRRLNGMLAAALLLIGVAGFYVLRPRPEAEAGIGGITCREIHELAPRYVAHKLDAATVGRIHQHLARCRKCREFVDDQKSEPLSATAAPGRRKSIGKHEQIAAANLTVP